MKQVHVGDVAVWRGEPPNGNPHSFTGPNAQCSLMGEERAAALRAFRDGVEFVVWTPEGTSASVTSTIGQYTFWYVPWAGGFRRITDPSEIR